MYVSNNRHNAQILYYRKYTQKEIKYPINKGNTYKMK